MERIYGGISEMNFHKSIVRAKRGVQLTLKMHEIFRIKTERVTIIVERINTRISIIS